MGKNLSEFYPCKNKVYSKLLTIKLSNLFYQEGLLWHEIFIIIYMYNS